MLKARDLAPRGVIVPLLVGPASGALTHFITRGPGDPRSYRARLRPRPETTGGRSSSDCETERLGGV